MILLLVLLLVGITRFARAKLIEQTRHTAEQKLSVIAQKLDMMTDQIENVSVLVLTDDSVQTWLRDVNAYGAANQPSAVSLNSYLYTMARMPFVSNIVIHPLADGVRSRMLYPYADSDEREFLERFYAEPAHTCWELRIGIRYTNRSVKESRHVLCYYQKVYSYWTTQLLGVVEIMVNEDAISGLYEDITLGETGYYCILDDGGMVVSAMDDSLLGQQYEGYLQEKPTDKARQISVDGINSLILQQEYVPLDWTLAGIVPVNEITGVVWTMTAFAVVLTGVAIVLSIILSNAIAGSISQPVVQLKNAMIEVGSGQRNIRLHLEREDEIGDLNREFLQMLREMDVLNQRVLEEHNQKKELELALILSQFSPHFLYNSLECICGLAAMGQNEDVISAITALSRFYRGVFVASERFNTVKGELDMARCYFDIMRYRYPGKLEYCIDYEENIRDLKIINMVLQPILENAIIHGLRNSRRPWKIELRAYSEGDNIIISVWDNGIGMSEETVYRIFHGERPSSRAHFGLRATDERVRKICGEDYGLQVYSTPGEGTMIVVNFPDDLEKRVSNV